MAATSSSATGKPSATEFISTNLHNLDLPLFLCIFEFDTVVDEKKVYISALQNCK
jgi:hypothetical protein